MGVILDSSILIAGERAKESVAEVLERVEAVCGKTAAALSAVTAVELTHGIYRARTDAERDATDLELVVWDDTGFPRCHFNTLTMLYLQTLIPHTADRFCKYSMVNVLK